MPMRPPPRAVALVAKTHWTVGVIIVASIAVLHLITRNLPQIEFGRKTYLITGSLAALYLTTGTLVWFGASLGRLLSRVCGLLYLSRPQFGSPLWDLMNSSEYREHFERKPKAEDAGKERGTTKNTNDAKEN